MKYVPLGRTGVFVSEFCLGTAGFGKEAGEVASVTMMNHAFEAGVNFFDTDGSLSEEMVGRWIGPHREAIILAAQVHSTNIILSVEQSLMRLQTGWIDILYLRHEDDGDGIEQSLDAVTTLIRQGKILYCGLAGFAAWQTMKAVAAAGNPTAVACVRPLYNLVNRQAEVEILPQAHSEMLAVFPCNPLAGDVLTGRLTENDRHAPISERFLEYARGKGLSPAALAVAWVAAHPAITAPILGARNLEELDDLLQSLDIVLAEEQRAEITALSIDPPLATDR